MLQDLIIKVTLLFDRSDGNIYMFSIPACVLCMMPEERRGLEQEIYCKQPATV